MAAGYPPYNPSTQYAGGDSVGYNGLAYVATQFVSGVPPQPTTPFWNLITPTGGGGGGGITNPLTANLDCATFDVYAAGRFNGATLECDTIDALPGSLQTEITVNQNLRVVGAGKNMECANDFLGRVATITQTSLNDVFDRAAGIVSYDPAQKLTVFNAPPLVPTSGVEVVGSVSASADVISSFGTNNYSLNTLGGLLTGLLARLDAVMVAVGQSTTVANYSIIGTPSGWVPDQSPPEAGGTNNGWRFTKAAGGGGGTKKMNWYPYNPLYGLSPPYVQPPASFLKRDLEACWAVITPSINIATQGVLFFNIFTYDYASPPTSTFSNRWDYCANNLALPLTTGGLTLQAGFKYLICCVDADKIVATPAVITNITNANGQFPSQTQTTKLRDPIDIHTDIPHIAFTAVALTTGTDPTPPADPSQVYVSAIALATTSSSVAGGLDFTVHSIGFRAGGYNVEYTTVYS